jgi:hypothetical protein
VKIWRALSAADKAIALTALLLAAAIGAIATALIEHDARRAAQPVLLELKGSLR